MSDVAKLPSKPHASHQIPMGQSPKSQKQQPYLHPLAVNSLFKFAQQALNGLLVGRDVSHMSPEQKLMLCDAAWEMAVTMMNKRFEVIDRVMRIDPRCPQAKEQA